jgi:hypothetical protein
MRRRFLCEFPIGFYVNLVSAVGAILVEGSKCWIHFWERTIQWLCHQHLDSHKNLLLLNHWTNCNQTLVEWSLDGPLPKMCPVIPISIQDVRQAKNRKKGRWNLEKSSLKLLSQSQPNFEEKIFLCVFPIVPYVKLNSAVGAILVEGPNRRTHFWKRTIQWLFHQNFLIEQMVSDKKIFMGISHRDLC